MRRLNTCTLLAMPAMLAFGLAACSSTPTALAPAPDKAPMAAAPAPAATPPTAMAPRPLPGSAVAATTLPAHLDPTSSLYRQRSVYFDFDAYSVRGDDAALIERHGRYLASHPAVAIRIEGHTDARGGVEYNLALGQRRAESVLQALRVYGVQGKQMEAVSWGESNPRAAGDGEAAWAQNRRADIQYPQQ